MDYGSLSTEEIRQGYRFDSEKEEYSCSYCAQSFRVGEVYPVGERFLLAERAVKAHIEQAHGGAFAQLIEGGAKYNTFTDTQKELLALFEQGLSDAEIANELGIKAATVRHQKFTFREKAKQAKYYLAVYDEVFGERTQSADDIVAIPNSATMMDDRYILTEKEKARILNAEFETLVPLRLKKFPVKAKRQVAVLSRIAEEFEPGKKYSYEEMKKILKPISADYSSFTRYLVDYGFMDRTVDGKQYWLK